MLLPFLCSSLLAQETQVASDSSTSVSFSTADFAVDPVLEEGIAWFDATKWDTEGKGWKDVDRYFARFPSKANGVIPDSVWNLSQHSAGMVVRFRTDSEEIRVKYKLYSSNLAMAHMPATGVSGLDLYTKYEGKWTWVACTMPGKQEDSVVLVSGLAPGMKEFMLYLPLYNGVDALSIGVPEGKEFSAMQPRPEKPIVYYGTSIAHGGCASRPGMAYTGILGRRLDYPIINLGFSGSARMEKEVADLLAEQDAALYVIDAVPNMHAELIAERAVTFFKTIREKRPETPILILEGRRFSNAYLIPSRMAAHSANETALQNAYDQLLKEGVKNLYYLKAENQLREDLDYDATVDSSHPNDLGMYRMTDVLEKSIRAIPNCLSYQDSFMKGKRFVAADYSAGRVCVVESDGSISQTEAAPCSNDVWILPENHLLFSTGNGVKEVDSEGNVCFEYNTEAEVYAVQRLANGNTFIGECSTGDLIEAAPDGSVVKRVSLLPDRNGGHAFIRNARVLPNGHYLVGGYESKRVFEVDADGNEVWSFATPGGAHSVVRLENGNTLVACGDNGIPCLMEVAPDKTVVWQVSNDDLEGKPFRFLTGFQKLPNGNYLVSNWIGHGQLGTAPHLMEITPDKKVVWTFEDHKNFQTIASVQVFCDDLPVIH
ncbi:MAG: SGNH/GDSL hydrolase family protein [Planctomycetia bacterium]|nr:SGNH/GDSL hydrolase family protein [Planctomycetia bacterium]